MLHSIELIDFKNHAETKVRLSDLTLLVGPNGAGKTGVLQGVHLASRLMREPIGDVLTGTDDARLLTRRNADAFRLKLAGGPNPRVITNDDDEDLPWLLDLTLNNPPTGSEAGTFGFTGAGEPPARKVVTSDSRAALKQFATARFALGSATHLRLDAASLAKPSYLDSTEAQIDARGFGLASAIAHLMTYERERFEKLEHDLAHVIPTVKRLRVRRIKRPGNIAPSGYRPLPQSLLPPEERMPEVLADELVLDMRSGDELPASAISEGTLMLLGLLTAISGPDCPRSGNTGCPRIVLIDDIDQSLHPRAQAELIKLLRAALEVNHGLQLIATSHSPYITDEFDDDEVWVLTQRDDGTAAAACLADHPDAQRFRGVLRTGEFLSSVGEDWVKEQGDADAPGTGG